MAIGEMKRKLSRIQNQLLASPYSSAEIDRYNLAASVDVARFELKAVQMLADVFRKYGDIKKAESHESQLEHYKSRLADAELRCKAANITEDEIRRLIRG